MQDTTRKRLVLAARVTVLVGLVAGINYVGNRLDFVHGNSVPITLAWIEGGAVSKGDYVVFEATHALINGGQRAHLTKKVVCVEGETVRFDGERFFCNDELIGAVIRETSTGTKIEVATAAGTIPAGKIFVAGDHPRSFDSRYLGLLDVQATTRVRPLL